MNVKPSIGYILSYWLRRGIEAEKAILGYKIAKKPFEFRL
jgi:hypothetical protein